MFIVADANIPGLPESFGQHGRVQAMDGRAITAHHVRNADALLVRSVTRVTRELLLGSSVGFVGTTTIGIDHLDSEWLDEAGITWASAPGCNADAAAQYTLGMILLAAERLGLDLQQQSVGIIGLGNVGSRLQRLLQALEVPVAACDPPLQARGCSGLVSLREVLQQPVVSLHVPLTREGPCPTWRMLDAPRLATLPRGALLVNAARGGVVDGEAVLNWLKTGRGHAAFDTWPMEPRIGRELLNAVTVATPHVAGYSERGRLSGAAMIYQAFCRHFGYAPHAGPEPGLPQLLPVHGHSLGADDQDLRRCVLTACPVRRDDQALRATADLAPEARAGAFDRLRREYPPRPEFSDFCLPSDLAPALAKTLQKLGFCV